MVNGYNKGINCQSQESQRFLVSGLPKGSEYLKAVADAAPKPEGDQDESKVQCTQISDFNPCVTYDHNTAE